MTNVETLLERTVESLTAHGYKPHFVRHTSTGEPEKDNKTISVEETFRRNHVDEENVTVTITVTKWSGEKHEFLRRGIDVANVKVPKGASERVLTNRIEKAIKAYNEA